MYDTADFQEAVDEFMENGMVYGILDYTNNPHQKVVPLTDISHKVDMIYKEGDQFFAEITLLDTEKGRIAKDTIEYLRLASCTTGVTNAEGVVMETIILYTALLLEDPTIKIKKEIEQNANQSPEGSR